MKEGRQITAYEVAAFTNQPTGGSPTGVVLKAERLSEAQMQQIAKVLGYSHTAFLTELDQEDCEVSVRFFTPAGEIKNCGHGTIAAHVVRTTQNTNPGDTFVRQRVVTGMQEVDVRHQDGLITVYFKQQAVDFQPVDQEVSTALLSALNLSEADLNKQYPIILASPGSNRFLVGVKDVATLQTVSPDHASLIDLCARVNSIGCFVFSLETFTVANGRMFAPVIGVNEDVVNGNSSGCLGAYLLHMDKEGRLGSELNLNVHQGHRRSRPGTVFVTARRVDGKIETITGGTAVITSQRQIAL